MKINFLKQLVFLMALAVATAGCGNAVVNSVEEDLQKEEDTQKLVSEGDEEVAEPETAILGKWERIADGLTEDRLNERTDGMYWEFFPDGTVRTYAPGYFPAENSYGLFVGIGTYTIDADFLVRKFYTDDGTCYREDRYKYEFNKKQLKLTKDPMVFPGMSEIYIVNVAVFKQIN
jgi:hypothetical protein